MNFLRMLESVRSPYLTVFFGFCTFFGEGILIFSVFCFLYWCVDKNLAYRIAPAFFVSALLVQEIKIVCRIERPWVLDPTFKAVAGAVPTATGYSFPSGHMQSSAALFGSFALYSGRRGVKIFCIGVILLVGLSRMYLGVHTPADVAGSLLLTSAVITAVFFFMKRFEKAPAADLAAAVFFAALSAACMVHAAVLLYDSQIGQRYAADVGKAAASGTAFAIGWVTERKYICFDERRGGWGGRIIRFACGITVTLLLYKGSDYLPVPELQAEMIRYFTVTIWAFLFYPLILKSITAGRDTYKPPDPNKKHCG